MSKTKQPPKQKQPMKMKQQKQRLEDLQIQIYINPLMVVYQSSLLVDILFHRLADFK